MFGDSHTQSSALNAMDSSSILPGKCFENMGPKFPAHTDAVVLYTEGEVRKACGSIVCLADLQCDFAAVRCEFDRVAQNIQ